MHRVTTADRHIFTRDLVVLAKRWRQCLDERLKGLGLTEARWCALYWLSCCPEGLSQSALAERAGVEATTLVRTIDVLERQGLVRREPSASDRRINVVRLTEAAAPTLVQMEALSDGLARETLGALRSEEYETLTELLQRLRERLDELDRPARVAA